MDEHDADDLLKRALIEPEDSAAVALRVQGLPLCDAVTVVFHGRRDLSTIQTYVTLGERGAGDAVSPSDLMRVPCDLDLAGAEDREEAEHMYAEQAAAFRDALAAADTVLDIWRGPLEELGEVRVMRAVGLYVELPAHRLLPTALLAPDRHLLVAAVCSARPLSAGRPPMGIVCAQQDVARVYPLPEDPEHCLDAFLAEAAEHAGRMAEQLSRQEASVARFLELSGDEFGDTA